MKKYTFENKGFTFERINKKDARSAYNNGLTVIFCPVNLRPFTGWAVEIPINKNDWSNKNKDFNAVVNSYEIYNCTHAETGRYTAFYIPVRRVDRFTGEEPTAATLGTIKEYNYKYMEV